MAVAVCLNKLTARISTESLGEAHQEINGGDIDQRLSLKGFLTLRRGSREFRAALRCNFMFKESFRLSSTHNTWHGGAN